MKRTLYILLLLAFLPLGIEAKTVKKSGKTAVSSLSEKDNELFCYYFYDAQKCFELEEYDQSLMLLEYCVKLNPNDAECHEMLGMIYGAMSASDVSAKHLEQACRLAPQEWRYRRTLASLYFQAEKNQEAIAVLKEGTRLNPDNSEIWTSLSAIYQREKDYKNSIYALNQVERINGPERNCTYQKFQLYTALGDKKKARKEIDKYIKAFPQDYEFQCFQGNMYLSEGKPDEALEIFNQVLREHPENPYVYNSLANYYNETGDKDKAVSWTLDALHSTRLDANGKLSVLHENIALLEAQNTDIGQLLVELIEHEPLDEQLHSYYAHYLEQKGDTSALVEELITITDINPNSTNTWTKLIDIAIATKDDSLFSEITNRAIEALPLDPQWYVYKCILLIREKKFNVAKEYNLHGIKLADKNLSVKLMLYRQLGDIYSLLEEYDNTFSAYDSALELYPEDLYVLNNYAYTLATHGGDLKKAERMSAKTIKAEPTNATYLDTYAWILHLQGNDTLAKFYIERAKEYVKPEEASEEIEEHYKIIIGE